MPLSKAVTQLDWRFPPGGSETVAVASAVPLDSGALTVCPACDMILATGPVEVPVGSRLICPRCRNTIRESKKDPVRRTLALSLTGLILFLPAHFLILMTFKVFGMQDQGSVFDSIRILFRQDYIFVAFLVLLTGMIFPLLRLALLFLVSLDLYRQRLSRLTPFMLRWYHHLEEWGMSEVYLIAILVAVTKMHHSTLIIYDKGFFCFIGLVAVMIGTTLVLDEHAFWERIEALAAQKKQRSPAAPAGPPPDRVSPRQTAMAAGLVQCRTCHKVLPFRPPPPGQEARCPRCGGRLHQRRPQSLATTWALVLSAIIFFLPANLMPIMKVEFLGVPKSSTIMDGITYFFQSGSFGIGLIILTASILVPLFKIIGLLLLLLSIRCRRLNWLTHKAVLFRFIEFIGRWSMLDVFVVSLLCALADFGFFTTIKTAAGVTFFSFVVLSTMFATISFDPRLLWDAALSNSCRAEE